MILELAASLNHMGMSDCQPVDVQAVVVSCQNQKVAALASSRSSIRSTRIQYTSEAAGQIRSLMVSSQASTPNLIHLKGEKWYQMDIVDCLSMLVSMKDIPWPRNTCQLLGAPVFLSLPGAEQVHTVHQHLTELWNQDCAVSVAFDTTATNTRHQGGACDRIHTFFLENSKKWPCVFFGKCQLTQAAGCLMHTPPFSKHASIVWIPATPDISMYWHVKVLRGYLTIAYHWKY